MCIDIRLLTQLEFCSYIESSRSPKWGSLRDEYVKYYPLCKLCNKPVEVVHHILPFHIYGELELNWNNLVSLCDECHIKYGHLQNFKSWNPILESFLLWKKYNSDFADIIQKQMILYRPFTEESSQQFIEKFLFIEKYYEKSN